MPTVAQVRAKAKALAKGTPREVKQRILTLAHDGQEQLAFEIARASKAAVLEMTPRDIESILPVLHDWCSTDCFASFLSGVAWREGVLTDAHILNWSASPNLWTRRAALVSTVPLNTKARGATATKGEARRTLAICQRFIDDREDMIVKALSWALRELVARDCDPVVRFLDIHGSRLAARVRREVNNVLTIGVKNKPRKNPKAAT